MRALNLVCPGVALALVLVGCAEQPRQDRRRVSLIPDTRPAAMTLRATFHYGAGFSAPVQALKIDGEGRWPTVVVIPGCAHAEVGRDFPRDVLKVSVDENPNQSEMPTVGEACLSHDPEKIRGALTRKLQFALENLRRLELADPHRIVLFGSGEAAPVVAMYEGAVRGKVLQGEPCYVSWPSRFDASTPTVVLRGDRAVGLQWSEVEGPKVTSRDAASPRAVGAAADAMARECLAQHRPTFPATYPIIDGPGAVLMFKRPRGVQAAGREAIARMLAD